MKIGLIVLAGDDPADHYGLAWAEFDEKVGFHRKDLRKLYLKARRNLAAKENYTKQQDGGKDGKTT